LARLDEIAEGLATVLASSPTPEPLNVDLRGQSPQEATFLVRAVVDACERRGAPISLVCVHPDFGSGLLKLYGSGIGYEGVQIQEASDTSDSLEFYRFLPK
jgi:hypothetical protein